MARAVRFPICSTSNTPAGRPTSTPKPSASSSSEVHAMRQMHRTLVALALVAAGVAAASPAAAQDAPANFMEWLRAEVKRTIDKDARAVAANGNGVANQKESPSTDPTSTSLVDT